MKLYFKETIGHQQAIQKFCMALQSTAIYSSFDILQLDTLVDLEIL